MSLSGGVSSLYVTMRIVNVTQGWCFQSLSDNEDSKCHSVVVFPVFR